MEQFHEYLYGNTFVIYMDNNPLTYILTGIKLDATGHILVPSLVNYNFCFELSVREGECGYRCSIPHYEGGTQLAY